MLICEQLHITKLAIEYATVQKQLSFMASTCISFMKHFDILWLLYTVMKLNIDTDKDLVSIILSLTITKEIPIITNIYDTSPSLEITKMIPPSSRLPYYESTTFSKLLVHGLTRK